MSSSTGRYFSAQKTGVRLLRIVYKGEIFNFYRTSRLPHACFVVGVRVLIIDLKRKYSKTSRPHVYLLKKLRGKEKIYFFFILYIF